MWPVSARWLDFDYKDSLLFLPSTKSIVRELVMPQGVVVHCTCCFSKIVAVLLFMKWDLVITCCHMVLQSQCCANSEELSLLWTVLQCGVSIGCVCWDSVVCLLSVSNYVKSQFLLVQCDMKCAVCCYQSVEQFLTSLFCQCSEC